jgi:hypothetical protein
MGISRAALSQVVYLEGTGRSGEKLSALRLQIGSILEIPELIAMKDFFRMIKSLETTHDTILTFASVIRR